MVPDLPSHRQDLLAGLNVNRLYSWDINKLGWLKAGKNGAVVTSSLDQLLKAYTPSVENCAEGRYGGSFTQGTEIDKPLGGRGRRLTDVYPFLRGVHIWQ